MSTGSDLALIGAPLKVLISCASVFFALCMRQLCSLHLFSSAFSMPLRPKRTCTGVKCFPGFHIKRFVHLFLFLRGPHT